MSQSKSILNNTLIYAVGNFGSKAIAFMLLPIYSYYLSTEEFGTYDLFLVAISFLGPLLTLQISDAAYRWLIETDDNKEKTNIISNGFILILVMLSIFLLGFFIFSRYIDISYKGYFLGILILNLTTPYFQKVLRGLGRVKEFAISGIIYVTSLLVFNLLFLIVLGWSIDGLFTATIISNCIVITYILLKISRSFLLSEVKFDKSLIKNMTKYSLPLVPNSLSWWLINASDKFLIVLILSVESNGIYAVSTRFATIIMLVNSIFLMAWQDKGLQDKGDNTKFYTNLFDTYINLEFTVILFLIAISKYLIIFTIGAEFHEAYKYLPLLFLGTGFSAFSAFFGVGYLKEKKTLQILVTSLLGGIINIVVSLSLLRFLGLFAPALGTFLSFLSVFIIRKFQTDKFNCIPFNLVKFSILTILCISFCLLQLLNKDWLNVILIIFSIFIFYLLNKVLLNKFFEFAKSKIN